MCTVAQPRRLQTSPASPQAALLGFARAWGELIATAGEPERRAALPLASDSYDVRSTVFRFVEDALPSVRSQMRMRIYSRCAVGTHARPPARTHTHKMLPSCYRGAHAAAAKP